MEARPNMIKKYNKPWIGFLGGILLPILSFLAYFIYMSSQTSDLNFPDFINSIKESKAFTPIVTLCVIPNLFLFFLFKKLEYWYAIKGIVTSVFIFLVLVIIVKFAQ